MKLIHKLYEGASAPYGISILKNRLGDKKLVVLIPLIPWRKEWRGVCYGPGYAPRKRWGFLEIGVRISLRTMFTPNERLEKFLGSGKQEQ